MKRKKGRGSCEKNLGLMLAGNFPKGGGRAVQKRHPQQKEKER